MLFLPLDPTIIESSLKSLLVPGVFFEEMGIRYIGPVNGHNLVELIRTLRRVKDNDLPWTQEF